MAATHWQRQEQRQPFFVAAIVFVSIVSWRSTNSMSSLSNMNGISDLSITNNINGIVRRHTQHEDTA